MNDFYLNFVGVQLSAKGSCEMYDFHMNFVGVLTPSKFSQLMFRVASANVSQHNEYVLELTPRGFRHIYISLISLRCITIEHAKHACSVCNIYQRCQHPTTHIMLYFSRQGNNFRLGNLHSAMQYTDEVDSSLYRKQNKKNGKRKCFLGLFSLQLLQHPPPSSDGCSSQVVDTGNQISSNCSYIIHLKGN